MRIPSLDGFRATSILLVIASHLTLEHPVPLLWRVQYGKLGVRVFFVISGFLITSLLLKERQKTGNISLSGFYLRRLFRIAPAYYVFLAAITLLIPTGLVVANYANVGFAAIYLNDYTFEGGTVGHTWSLAVEEQFYLLWPLLLVLSRRPERVCLGVLLVAPVFRLLSSYQLWPSNAELAFECVCDSLATGCLLALWRERLWESLAYRTVVSSRWVIAIPSGTLLVLAVLPSSIVVWVLGGSALNIGIAMVLDRYMRMPDTIIGRGLNWAPVAWLGTLSYSLYLWQQPWMAGTVPLPWYIKIGGALLCAAASYYWIEKPCLALRKRWDTGPSLPPAGESEMTSGAPAQQLQ